MAPGLSLTARRSTLITSRIEKLYCASRALVFDTTVFPLVSLIDASTQQHLVGQQIDRGTLDPLGVGLPFDAAFTPDGDELWVVNAASNDVKSLSFLVYDRKWLTDLHGCTRI